MGVGKAGDFSGWKHDFELAAPGFNPAGGTDSTQAASSSSGASEALKDLMLPGMGFPRPNQSPKPEDVKRFKEFFAQLRKDGKVGDLKKAVEAEEKRERDAITGGRPHPFPIPDWYGVMEVVST